MESEGVLIVDRRGTVLKCEGSARASDAAVLRELLGADASLKAELHGLRVLVKVYDGVVVAVYEDPARFAQ